MALTIEQQRAMAVASARLRMDESDPNAKYKALQTRPNVDPTEGQSFIENVRGGLGKMMVDTGRGVKQLLRIGDQQQLQQTIDEEKALSKPLMETGGGLVGNIGGHIGAALLPGAALSRVGNIAKLPGLVAAGNAMMAPPMTLGGAAIGAGMGGAQGLIQPVASDESRAANVMIPAVAGAALPLLGMGWGAAKGAIEPLYQGGQERIVGRALRSAVGERRADVVANRLSQGASSVPGVQPTAAEVGRSGGISAMQRAASAVDPEEYAARAVANNEARKAALEQMAGTGGERKMYEGVRDMMTEIPYEQAMKTGVDKQMAKAIQPQIDSLLARPSVKSAIAGAKEIMDEESIALAKSGSPKGLQLVKQALDDAIERGSNPTTKMGTHSLKALKQTRGDLISVMEDIVPKLRGADAAYRDWSRPINQMDVAQTLLNKSVNPVTQTLEPRAFIKNVSDETVRDVTGYSGSNLANTMTSGQLGLLRGITDDLRGVRVMENLGRGAGSDSVQKLAMTNLMQQSGLPLGLLNMYGMGSAGRLLFSQSDEAMKRQLANALLDPKQTAALMAAARRNPQLAAAIEEARKIAAPAILGGALSLNAQQ